MIAEEMSIMVSPRANWKGHLKLDDLSCAVALYTAVSSSERIAFHVLNRKTGNRVHRQFIDSETEDTVERDDQIKGYEIENGRYVTFEPEEVAAAIPDSDKTLDIEAFIACGDIDTTYFDRPYYLAPDKTSLDAFLLIRDAMKQAEVAAIARTVLFRRLRTILIHPHGRGLIATTLNSDYEVRSRQEAFKNLPELKIAGEMLELAEHIIATKKGEFDARAFDDRYEAAVADLVNAKIEGKPLPKKKKAAEAKPKDLLQALRSSAALGEKRPTAKRSAASADHRARHGNSAARDRRASTTSRRAS